jgi:3D (Asp-Asp-Asp) domain-containing protein
MPPSALLPLVLAAGLLGGPSHARARPTIHKPLRMTATAYCDKGITGGGNRTRAGVVAADPRLLPIGTVLRIDGLGTRARTYVVDDTGSAVKGRRIDIFMPSCRAAKRFGRRHVVVRTVTTARPSEKRGHAPGK